MNYRLISYAEDFVAFLIEKLGKDTDKIIQIILFGSVTRGEENKNSDIDLFVEISQKYEEKLKKIRDEFYNSAKAKKYWNLLNVNNEINLSIGALKDWGDLQASIIANGIVLYGKYKGIPKIEQNSLFIISSGKNRNKNISVWRELYGYTQKVSKKVYIQEGLIKEYSGKKLTRGVFVIPSEHTHKIISFLREKKMPFQIFPFWNEKN